MRLRLIVKLGPMVVVILKKWTQRAEFLCLNRGIIIIGSESEEDPEMVTRKTIREVSKNLCIKAKTCDFKVKSIVANIKIGWLIDIKKIAQSNKGIKD